MDTSTQTDNLVTMTPSAAKRVWELLSQEGNYNLKLRVYIRGGGCSGFEYGFAFDEALKPDDCVMTCGEGDNTVELVIDALSIMYLSGATIDYVESLQGAHFSVKNNPNAQTTCSCGSSFSI